MAENDRAPYWEQYSKKRIIGLAIERNLSLRKISIELDRGATYVQNIVGGKDRNVSLRKFLEILDVLQVSPQEFFDPNFRNISLVKQATDAMNRLPENEVKMLIELAQMLAERLELEQEQRQLYFFQTVKNIAQDKDNSGRR